MSRLIRVLSAMPIIALTACVTMNVSADIAPGTDFSSYRTYAWDPEYSDPTDDPRLNNTFFDSRVRSFVGEGLATRGLREVSAGSADLLIHYHASVHRRVDVYTTDSEHGYEYYGTEEQTYEYEYEEGILVLCIADPKTTQIVWRGWVQTNVDGVMDNPERMEERLAEAVRKVLERFPVPTEEGSQATS